MIFVGYILRPKKVFPTVAVRSQRKHELRLKKKFSIDHTTHHQPHCSIPMD